MRVTHYSVVVLACTLFAGPMALAADDPAELNRTPDRFGQVMGSLQYRIQAHNLINELEEAYWHGEGYSVSDSGIRKRDLKGFDLQLDILRIRLSMPD